MSTTFNPANDVVLLRRVELTAKGMAYLPGGGVQPEEAERKDLPAVLLPAGHIKWNDRERR